MSQRFTSAFYDDIVLRDAKALGLTIKPEAMRKGNEYLTLFSGDFPLKVGASLETSHLTLGAVRDKVWVGEEGSGMRTEHLILVIKNRTQEPLAYRVSTTIEGPCGTKGTLPHNALAIKPGEEIRRTECLPQGPALIHINKVEVLQILPLGYFYISRLDPDRLQTDRRVTDGHRGPNVESCKLLPWRAIQQAFTGGAKWYDVLDFYARHNCDEFFFYPAYRWNPSGPSKLPSSADE